MIEKRYECHPDMIPSILETDWGFKFENDGELEDQAKLMLSYFVRSEMLCDCSLSSEQSQAVMFDGLLTFSLNLDKIDFLTMGLYLFTFYSSPAFNEAATFIYIQKVVRDVVAFSDHKGAERCVLLNIELLSGLFPHKLLSSDDVMTKLKADPEGRSCCFLRTIRCEFLPQHNCKIQLRDIEKEINKLTERGVLLEEEKGKYKLKRTITWNPNR
jgi:hypothetical protein